MSDFVIEKDIPFEVSKSGLFRVALKYPLKEMKVGDSFFIEIPPDVLATKAKSILSTIASMAAKFDVPSPNGETMLNRKGETVPVMLKTRAFKLRSYPDTDKTGVRIWRTL